MAVRGKKIREVYEVHTGCGQSEFVSVKCGGYWQPLMAFKRLIVPTSQQTQCFCVTQKDQLILFSAVIAVLRVARNT